MTISIISKKNTMSQTEVDKEEEVTFKSLVSNKQTETRRSS